MYTGEYTPFHLKYFATQLTLKRPSNSIENLATSLGGARVDLNPHQIELKLLAEKNLNQILSMILELLCNLQK